MLIVVVAMFGICWMPLHILNVILNFRTESSSSADDTLAAIYISAHWLAMANSFANPIIYSFTNSIFRVKNFQNVFIWQRTACSLDFYS
jgi:hypothetical protein